jgi:hypothetical protein
MKNQEVATYNWNGVIKKWTASLRVEDKLVFIGQYDTYIEAVECVQERATGKVRAILSTSPKKPHRGF